jgi:beta-galactosidase/beta-glucuronidase
VSFRLRHGVRTWKGEAFAAEAAPQQLQLAAGESKTIEQTIRIPDARLWSPEDPFL